MSNVFLSSSQTILSLHGDTNHSHFDPQSARVTVVDKQTNEAVKSCRFVGHFPYHK